MKKSKQKYPGVGPDGIYRLHSGVDDGKGSAWWTLRQQLHNGGNVLRSRKKDDR